VPDGGAGGGLKREVGAAVGAAVGATVGAGVGGSHRPHVFRHCSRHQRYCGSQRPLALPHSQLTAPVFEQVEVGRAGGGGVGGDCDGDGSGGGLPGLHKPHDFGQ